MDNKLLVTVAPSIPPYIAKDIPGLDLSPKGIADEVVRACNAGANIVHLHVWDESGQPTTDLKAFQETMERIRDRCDIVIEGSTGGMNDLTPAERSVSLGTEIEMASLNPGSVNYDSGVYINSPADIAYWAERMHFRRIKPDIAIFEVGMVATALNLVEQGWINEPLCFTFVLGQKGALPATHRHLSFLANEVPKGALWSVVGHSGQDLRMSALALSMGGHVRAGFEDNPFYRPGERATSNAQLIERLVHLASLIGREVASPAEARDMLGLTSQKEELAHEA